MKPSERIKKIISTKYSTPPINVSIDQLWCGQKIEIIIQYLDELYESGKLCDCKNNKI